MNRRNGFLQSGLARSAVAGSAILLCAVSPALAHVEGAGAAAGLFSGFRHPFSGLDHLIAMVAVGLWGAFLGRPALYVLPIVFPVVMAFGGTLGIAGAPLIHVETGIALSAILLGLAVATALKPPLALAALLVGAFAIFHGHGHGAELPQAANPFAYSAGFVIATGALHLSGIGLGMLSAHRAGAIAVRAAGAGIAAGGVYFLAT